VREVGQRAGRAGDGVGRVSGSVLAQYVALAMTWGTSFLFIKIGLEGLSPGQVVLARLTAGAAALVVMCAVTRQAVPRDPAVWGHLLVMAVLMCVFPFLMFAWAEQNVSSGMASILNATTPLMTMLVALTALPQERPTRTRLIGLMVGFVGVTLVLAPWRPASAPGLLSHSAAGAGGSNDSVLWGQLACLAATFSYGIAFVYLRRFVSPRGLPALPVATVQVGLGALLMLALSPVLAWEPIDLTWRVTAAMAALGVLGTGLAYVWNTNIVAGWGATNASTVTYLTPLFGVVAGTVVLAERLSWNEPVGAVIVIIGIAVSQGRLSGLARRHARSSRAHREQTGTG
jgi:drug/metabolite transporter (DMT)-like permease